MSKLNFYWRMGDYALEACPKRLVKEPEEVTAESEQEGGDT